MTAVLPALAIVIAAVVGGWSHYKVADLETKVQLAIENSQKAPPHRSRVSMVVFGGASEDCEEMVVSLNPPSFAPLLAVRNTLDPLEDAHLLVGFRTALDSVRVRFPHDTLNVRFSEDRRLFDVEIPQLGGGAGDIWIQAFGVRGDAIHRDTTASGSPYFAWTFESRFSANTKTIGDPISSIFVPICETNVEEALRSYEGEWESVPPSRTEAGDIWAAPPGLRE